MINKFKIGNLRNAEHYLFMYSVCEIFDKYGIDPDNLGALYVELRECAAEQKSALTVEEKNKKVSEKNEADNRRDKLHSKLFNYLKSILCDEADPRFDDAQTVMQIMKKAGNPVSLAENAESAMLEALGSSLEPLKSKLAAINAQEILDALMEANNRFIALEKECREFAAAVKSAKGRSMGEIRKHADAIYRTIINAINSYAQLATKRADYSEMIVEMNVLAAKYDHLLMMRKSAAAKRNN